MTILEHLLRFLARFRYPVSLPEDVASALGITISNHISFHQLVSKICSCHPTRLNKLMHREEAEKAFSSAVSCEKFLDNTVCSFCFTQGRVVFVLKFDQEERLRHIVLQHKLIRSDQGVEIPLNRPSQQEQSLLYPSGSLASIKG